MRLTDGVKLLATGFQFMDSGANILSRQNESENIELLAAMRQLYSEEKKLLLVQCWTAIGSSVIAFAAVTFFPKYVVLANSFAVACCFFDCLFLQHAMGSKKRQAAQIQELFDSTVLQMAQDDDELPKPEVIIAAADRHPLSGRETLQSWYLGKLDEVPFSVARIVCQMTNVTYDNAVRKRYVSFLWCALGVMIFAPILYSVLFSISMDKILSDIYLPVSPSIAFSGLQLKEHRLAINRLEGLREQVQHTWASCKREKDDALDVLARKLQNKIFSHRAESATLFDKVYWACRPKQELYGGALANKLVSEYHESKVHNESNNI
jgi:hypothetical protein